MNKKNRKLKKNNITAYGFFCLSTAALAALLSACGGNGRMAENAAASPSEIVIDAGSAEEGQPIVRMDLDGAVLPVLPDITTAEDNSQLAPAYLRKGDQHEVVKQLQQRLMNLGYMDNDDPTNFYGDATAVAVRHFQRQNEITQDGICGTETWDKIFSASAPYYAVSNGTDGDDVAQIQQRLYELGYLANASDVTGHFGDSTEEAVKKLQNVNALSVDGTVGKETINLIYSDEVKPNLIAFGEESEIVLKCQKRLKELGYLRDEPDGKFGNATQVAIKEFQSRNDLIVDGYLGPTTRLTLESSDARPFGLRVGDQSESVWTVQKRLNHYGYLASSLITGYYGDLTEDAVIAFQRNNSLAADGTVGVQTMAKLESGDAKKKPAETQRRTQPTTRRGSSGSSGGNSNSGGNSGGNSSGNSGGSTGGGGATVSGSASALISKASSKLGCPYVWGAKGPNSFDCSGFVYWCLNQVGVRQSYLTSSGWRNPGRYQRVSSFDSLRAGDIIVVSGHVGIVAGGGTVIDASSSNGRVVHRSLSSWWRNNFIVGWRIFG
ncbi:MAG: peptidoglycan-binding protein [Eubacteriales bacterium]|nr:peptidoglycan-binding protein [Eubacteriales bacterium]